MHDVATKLRTLQIFAHNSHNEASGLTFLADHEYMGELYAAYESAYDSVIERLIGLGEEVDIVAIGMDAIKAVAACPSTDACFESLLEQEGELRKAIAECIGEYSIGSQNLMAQLADDSEQRSFIIGQRVQ